LALPSSTAAQIPRFASRRAGSRASAVGCAFWPAPPQFTVREFTMIILGIILLVVGFLIKIPILWTIGIIVLVIGAILFLLGMAGREVGGRRHYW
jgi:Family of unknown function (DUF6131)